jgi:hypothetical protein
MSGMKKAHASAKTKRDPDSPINKALRRWNCESIEEMQELIQHAEKIIAEEKQRLDPSCWKGYKKQGTKMKGGVRVNNCVPKESLKEFAPDGDNGDEEESLHKYARMWYNGDDDTRQHVEKILDRMGWEIGEIESEEGGCFVVQSGDEHGRSYIGFAPEDL